MNTYKIYIDDSDEFIIANSLTELRQTIEVNSHAVKKCFYGGIHKIGPYTIITYTD